jgi:molybdopterin converting factor small subunit
MSTQQIRVQVRFFASARECAGTTHVVQTLPAGATVGDLLARLYETYPGLRDLRLRYAVNAAYVAAPGAAPGASDVALHDGDELACIPPVGGG